VLDLPDQPVLDKQRLIGRCARLPARFDAARLEAEVARLPPGYWGGAGGRAGVQQAAEAIFLRGFPPAVGDKPIEDRPALALLPYARELIYDSLGARPLRCLLARLPAGGFIAPHIDVPPYFAKTIRLHFPVVTQPDALMYSVGLVYAMAAGEIWALNNSATHAVWNRHASAARTHMICDFLPTPALLEQLAAAERELGRRDEAMEQRLRALPPAADLY
jgi:hypothetical protein